MQGGREQQRLVHIRGSKTLSHGRILSPNTLWKSCHVWCFRRIYSRQTPSLPDVDAELEQFTMDARCTPGGVLAAHLADQISDLARNDRLSRLPTAHLPSPEQAKAGTMPGNDRLGLNHGQRRAPVGPHAGQQDPQKAVHWG